MAGRNPFQSKARPTERLLATVDAAIIGTVFLLSRAAYIAAGVVFDDTPLLSYWQYLPVDVLQYDLVRGLVALHSQPPLFNLFLGIGVKSPAPLLFFETTLRCASFILALSMFYIFRAFALSRTTSHVATGLFLINPVLILYESWLFYTLPEAALVTLAAAGLARWDRSKHVRLTGLVIFAFAASALVLLRSAFHPVWAGLAAVVLISNAKRSGELRWTVIALASVAMLSGLAVSAKNYWLVGRFTTSTWSGMNISRIAFRDVDVARREALINEGRMASLCRVSAFLPLDAYEPYSAEFARAIPDSPMVFHGALTTRQKPGSGEANFNNIRYVAISEIMGSCAREYIRADPQRYASNVAAALKRFGEPGSANALLDTNRGAVSTLVAIFESITHPRGTVLTVWLSVVAALVGAIWLHRRDAVTSGNRTVVHMTSLTVLWFAAVPNFVEFGENNRFRVAVDPLLYTWSWLLLDRASRAFIVKLTPSSAFKGPAILVNRCDTQQNDSH